MATVVDSLKLVLTVDKTDFEKKTKTAEQELERTKKNLGGSLKGIDEATKKTFEGFTALTRAAVGFFAAIIGARGFSELIEHMTNLNVQLGNFSNMIDIGPQRINAWGLAVRALGGDAKAAQAAFLQLNNTFEAWRMSGKIGDEQLRMGARGGIHLSPKDDAPTQMAKIGRMLQTIKRNEGEGAATYAAAQFGLTDPGLIKLLEEQGANVNNAVSKYDRFGPTDEQIKNSEKLLKDWVDLSGAAESFGNTLADKISPALQKSAEFTAGMLDDFNQWIKGNSDWQKQQDEKAKVRAGQGGFVLDAISKFMQDPVGNIGKWYSGLKDSPNYNPD